MADSDVAPSGESSSTMRPCLETKIRSDRLRISGRYEDMTTTARPSSARLPIMLWISAIAPTSTPRVGSSKMDQFGRLDQRFRNHHLLLIAARKFDHARVAVQGLDVELARPLGSQRLHLAHAGDSPARLRARDVSHINVFRDRHGFKKTI